MSDQLGVNRATVRKYATDAKGENHLVLLREGYEPTLFVTRNNTSRKVKLRYRETVAIENGVELYPDDAWVLMLRQLTIHGLIQGGETTKKIDALISLTKIRSIDLIKCLNDHFNLGTPEAMCVMIYDVPQQNLNSTIKSISQVNTIVQNIIERGGLQTEKGWELLSYLLLIKNPKLHKALKMHFVDGHRPFECYKKHGIREQNFSLSKKKVQKVIDTIEVIKGE